MQILMPETIKKKWVGYVKFDHGKVEKFLKGSLDSIQSPSTSVKIQIVGEKVCLRWKGKILPGVVNKVLKTKSKFSLNVKMIGLNPGWLHEFFSTLPVLFNGIS